MRTRGTGPIVGPVGASRGGKGSHREFSAQAPRASLACFGAPGLPDGPTLPVVWPRAWPCLDYVQGLRGQSTSRDRERSASFDDAPTHFLHRPRTSHPGSSGRGVEQHDVPGHVRSRVDNLPAARPQRGSYRGRLRLSEGEDGNKGSTNNNGSCKNATVHVGFLSTNERIIAREERPTYG